MANVSQQFMDDMGPLSAMWAGRDQGLSENTSQVQQQVGLESIANSQQNRDIAKQKLPFELGQLKHQEQMNPLLIQEKEGKIKSDKVKLDKDQFDNFFGEFKQVIPTLQGTPADGAILGEVAKKHGMDPADPRIRRMIDTAASGNAQAVNDMLKKIALADAKHQQDMAKEYFSQTQQTGRTLLTEQGADRRAQLQAETSRMGIAQRAAAVAAKAETVKQTVNQQIAQLEREMAAAPTAEQKQALANRIKYLVDTQREIAQAVQQQRTEDAAEMINRLQTGQPFVPPTSNLTTPPNTPPGDGVNTPKPVTQQRAVGTKAKTKDGRDVTWDGKGWVLD